MAVRPALARMGKTWMKVKGSHQESPRGKTKTMDEGKWLGGGTV